MARVLNGSTDSIGITGVAQTGQNMFSFWIRPGALPAAGDLDIIFTYYDQSESEPYLTYDKLFYLNSAGIIKFYIYDGAERRVASTTALVVGTWYHIGARTDGTNISIYVNGVREAQTAAGASYTSYADPALRIGGTTQTVNDGESTRTRFNGRIADLAGWTAGSDAELEALAKGRSPLKINRVANRLFYIPLLGQASTEPDYFGGGVSGVVSGTTLADHAPVHRGGSIIWIPGQLAGGGGTPQELAATGTVLVQGTAALTAQKPLAAVGTVAVQGTAALSVGKPLGASGEVLVQGAAELRVQKPLAATGVVQVEGAAQLSGAVEMEAHGTVQVQAGAELSVGKPLGASGSVLVEGTAGLQVVHALATVGSVSVEGGAVLEVRKLLASSGQVLVQGSANLQVGTILVLEIIDRDLLFQRTIARDLGFTRAIERNLRF